MYPQDPQDPRAWQTQSGYEPPPRRPATSKTAVLVVVGGAALLFAAGMASVFILVGAGTPAAEPASPAPTFATRAAAPEVPAASSTPPAALSQPAVIESPSAAQPAETAQPAEQPHAPKVLLQDSGNGHKNTALFTVDDSWQVHYTYDCTGSSIGKGGMSATLMDGTKYVDLVLNEVGTKTDKTTPEYRAGTFHLEVTASLCAWTIEVVDV